MFTHRLKINQLFTVQALRFYLRKIFSHFLEFSLLSIARAVRVAEVHVPGAEATNRASHTYLHELAAKTFLFLPESLKIFQDYYK